MQEKLQCEKVQNAQPSQQSKNSTSSFLQNSDSSVSKLSSHNIPVVPRRSKTPPCLNGRGIDESILPNQNDQDKGLSRSYANIKFPSGEVRLIDLMKNQIIWIIWLILYILIFVAYDREPLKYSSKTILDIITYSTLYKILTYVVLLRLNR